MAFLQDFELEYLEDKDMSYFVPELKGATWSRKAYVANDVDEANALLAEMDLKYTVDDEK